MNFHGSFEEIRLLFHDTVERGDIFVALTICREKWAYVSGRLDGDEAAVTLIPALAKI